MTNEMVERVARAIQASRGPKENWDFVTQATCDLWRADARAAIAAMREPNEGQLYAAHKATGGDILVGESREVWHAMIDAALADNTP